MGGLALKKWGIETSRLPKDEYFKIQDEILQVLTVRGLTAEPVKAYRNKESFGDLDVVILDTGNLKIRETIMENFKPKAIHQNSNCYSFDYENFQIDFTIHPEGVYRSALDYYHYSPAGNAVGKLFHQMKLSYGHTGLVYIIREEDVDPNANRNNSHVLMCPVLSTNTQEIHNFIGLDHEKWKNGFETEEEIFEWIAGSRFFNPQLFAFEQMNHRSRTRDRKRPDYHRLMAWIDANKSRLPNYKRFEDKSDYLPMIHRQFPMLKTHMDECRVKYNKRKELHQKFNGHMVSEITGLVGKDLGDYIRDFKFEHQYFQDWLEKTSQENIYHEIKKFYNKYSDDKK